LDPGVQARHLRGRTCAAMRFPAVAFPHRIAGETMRDGTRIPVVLCIDVEPDAPVPPPYGASLWSGFPAIHEKLMALRRRLSAITGSHANFSWFLRLDPQVEFAFGSADWVVAQHADLIDALRREEDEVGLHVHVTRWCAERRVYVVEYGDRASVERCVRLGATAFRGAFDQAPRAFRFGFGWMNTDAAALLESIGVRYDLSVECGRRFALFARPGEIVSPHVVDHSAVPRMPYRPSKADYRVADTESATRMWCLPITTGTAPVLFELIGHLRRGRARWPQHSPLAADLSLHPGVFRRIIDRWLVQAPHPYLVLVVRSSTATNELRACFESNLEVLCHHAQATRFRYTTPGDAISILYGDEALT
jgi:hypothetical protein